MKFYADASGRRSMQLLADALMALWVLMWILIGKEVHDRSLVAQRGADQLRDGSTSLQDAMNRAAGAVKGIPFVGGDVAKPFRSAAQTSGGLATSGADLATGLGRLAIILGVLAAALPIVCAVIPWAATRLLFARRAGRLARLRSMPGGQRLLALEALHRVSPRRLAQVSPDPAGEWSLGQPEVTRELASLALARQGLRNRGESATQGRAL